MTQVKHCPYCGEELPASMLNSGNRKKTTDRTFKASPQLGWIVLLIIVVVIFAAALPQ